MATTEDIYGRRKWDTDEYERKAQKRLKGNDGSSDDNQSDGEDSILKSDAKETIEPKKRENLKPREFKVDLEKCLGKTVVINKTTATSQTGGFYCDVCDCVVKDSINYLDHINGKKHQRNLGMNMRVNKSTLEDVRRRFQMQKKKLEEVKKEFDIEDRVKELKEEEERLKEYQRDKRKEKKKKKRHGVDEEDGNQSETDEMAKLMGFSKFSNSKKK
ncbi:zinc finger matrin-type protein 2-like [Oppia nitens]|uniref:zinc finger matrin-type protein 2-like n=1 Tax=Oppia nitens TaxID=1686743 RepID=UPI0023DB36C9|nr:zinc finger matrin-type protein 2-like [Oppia nitens]